MKKTFIFLSAFVVLSAFATSSIWKNDTAHSQLMFTVTHLGLSEVSGMFTDFSVTIDAQEEDFSDAVFEMTAQAASLDTRVEARNNHLKSADFFDVEKYPTLYFKSTALNKVAENKYKLTGNLTLHGVTKTVTMDLTYNGRLEDAEKKTKTAGFQLTGMLKRSDFGIGNGFPPPMISDEVEIKADGEFISK